MNAVFLQLISPEFIHSVIRMTTPILFVALASLVTGMANVLCIGFEGVMLFAAFGGVLGSAFTHTVVGGLAFGLLLGVIAALTFAYFVLYLDTDPMLIGLALNLLGSAGTVFFLFLLTGSKSTSTDLASLTFPVINIPVIENIPVLGPILSGHNLLTYVSIVAVFFCQHLLYKTPLGLRIRSVGEAPNAAESVGIDVKRTRLISLFIGGILASLGGIFMSMAYLPYFTKDMVAGRGFIGIAAQSLGAGSPIRTFIWTLLFGGADALGNIAQSFRLPSQFAQALPYLVTLIGLILMHWRKKRAK